MSQQYDEYLHEHISNVAKGAEWLIDHGIVEPEYTLVLRELCKRHDQSKYTVAEYDAYDDYFYGPNKGDPDVQESFDYAWLEHIHNNMHHWQYWVLVNDDEGKPKPLEMPKENVYEMIADWWSFSWKSGNLREILDWYADHEEKMILHPETRKLVDHILDEIERRIEK